MGKLKAVMFDMDGVLIDSERMNMNMWDVVNEQRGHVFDISILTKMMGGSPQDNWEKYGHLLPSMEVYNDMKKEVRRRVAEDVDAHGMPQRPGVEAMMQTLKEKGIRRLIVSSTPRANALHVLEKADLADKFDNGIFGDEAGRRKPYPDLYLKMMEMEGLKPEETIIVEDSSNGVMSGYAAGVRVFAIPDTAPLEQFRDKEAYRIVDSMDDVRKWVLEETEK